jgi:hypothetical protein
LEEVTYRGDRADRVERSLVIPAADTGVEDCVRKREEQLDIGVDPVGVRAVVVSVGNKLREEVPVPGRQFGVGPVGPILGNHLLLIISNRR